MTIRVHNDLIAVCFPGGGKAEVRFADIASIDLQTIPTVTVDVDAVSLNHENGDSLEIMDDAEGFSEACDFLSAALKISPGIRSRFPVANGMIKRIFTRVSA